MMFTHDIFHESVMSMELTNMYTQSTYTLFDWPIIIGKNLLTSKHKFFCFFYSKNFFFFIIETF